MEVWTWNGYTDFDTCAWPLRASSTTTTTTGATSVWKVIPQHPAYSINAYGEIKHTASQRCLCADGSGKAVTPRISFNAQARTTETVEICIYSALCMTFGPKRAFQWFQFYEPQPQSRWVRYLKTLC